ncbi:MAG: type II toxin-antitoxin system HicB family antitoxin [Oscillospiraceae bacterium]|nr:type II toxin-antitoxin system HicB family antitoxin [Oscillospiraceae bacterium]
MKRNLTVVIEKDNESGGYVGFAPGIPGAHTCAESIEQLYVNLKEVTELCLEEMNSEQKREIPDFFAISHIEVAV